MKPLSACVLALLSLGCSGGGVAADGAAGSDGAADDGGSTCGHVEPCGGDPTGTWTFASACVLDASILGADFTALCPVARFVVNGVSGSGSLAFQAGRAYLRLGTLTFDMTVTLPLSCFATGRTCAGLQNQYTQGGAFTTATCAVASNACTCHLVQPRDVGAQGTWATTGSTFTTTADGVTEEDQPYCIVGDELHEVAVDVTMPTGPMMQAKIRADVVFTRQR